MQNLNLMLRKLLKNVPTVSKFFEKTTKNQQSMAERRQNPKNSNATLIKYQLKKRDLIQKITTRKKLKSFELKKYGTPLKPRKFERLPNTSQKQKTSNRRQRTPKTCLRNILQKLMWVLIFN